MGRRVRLLQPIGPEDLRLRRVVRELTMGYALPTAATPARTLPPARAPLIDAQGRVMTYLRLSLTDRCNFRCVYCSPATWGGDSHLLTPAQIEHLVGVFASMGIRRLRLTGGEPLFRKDILEITERIAGVPGIDEVCATTNGHLLSELAQPLQMAGLKSLNISVDTLDPIRFAQLSGGRGDVERVLAGVDAAIAAGLDVKLNAVILAGVNDDDCADLIRWAWSRRVVPRFIECMPFRDGKPVPTSVLIEKLRTQGLQLTADDLSCESARGPARYFVGAGGRVGFISPMTQNFCGGATGCGSPPMEISGRAWAVGCSSPSPSWCAPTQMPTRWPPPSGLPWATSPRATGSPRSEPPDPCSR